MKNKKISKRIIRNNLVAYSFVIVSLVTLLVLVYIPMISTVDYSFRRIGMVGVGEDAWIGLENYRMLFSQSTFWKAIGNTILMAVMGLLTIPVGFLLAVLVNSLGRSRLQEFFRVGFYLPNIITGVSVYLIFRVVLMTDGGLLNNVLSAITGRQVSIGWLADPKFARWGVTIIWVWMNAGYSMLMNLASLQAIPTDLYEAASIDGANAIQKLVSITVPNMKSCFALLFVTGMINGLARFTDIYILGGMDCYGGAGGTLQTILMYVFQFSFETPNDDVKQFRWREALETLSRVSKSLKEYNPKLEITCCVHATLNGYYVTELRGYDNWDMVAACDFWRNQNDGGRGRKRISESAQAWAEGVRDAPGEGTEPLSAGAGSNIGRRRFRGGAGYRHPGNPH